MKITAWLLLCLFVLSGCASRVIRPPDDGCPGTSGLPPVCLKGSVVVPCYATGDINVDGQINLGDLIVLNQYVLGIECSVNWIYGDMNGDGQLNVADILLLQKALLGL